jgi:hypothetical protein
LGVGCPGTAVPAGRRGCSPAGAVEVVAPFAPVVADRAGMAGEALGFVVEGFVVEGFVVEGFVGEGFVAEGSVAEGLDVDGAGAPADAELGPRPPMATEVEGTDGLIAPGPVPAPPGATVVVAATVVVIFDVGSGAPTFVALTALGAKAGTWVLPNVQASTLPAGGW